ncbi:hypothetical protein Ancab_039732 [Ancistrocladus abbreviatus]
MAFHFNVQLCSTFTHTQGILVSFLSFSTGRIYELSCNKFSFQLGRAIWIMLRKYDLPRIHLSFLQHLKKSKDIYIEKLFQKLFRKERILDTWANSCSLTCYRS